MERIQVEMRGAYVFDCPRCGARFTSGVARLPVRALDATTQPAGVICRACAGDVSEADSSGARSRSRSAAVPPLARTRVRSAARAAVVSAHASAIPAFLIRPPKPRT